MSVRILTGDALAMLRTLDAESVQVCVTSPPYFQLRDYGVPGQIGLEQTPGAFIAALVAVFDEVRRVLRPDGLCFVNLGDSYAGSGKGPTGYNGIGDQEQRQGFTGVSAKSTLKGYTAGSQLKKAILGGGAGVDGLPPKNLLLMPERLAIAMQDAGWWVRSRIAWCKASAMPESVRDRPTSAWEHIWMFAKSRQYFYDAAAVAQPSKSTAPSGNGYARPERLSVDGVHQGQSAPWQVQPTSALRNFWLLGPEPQGAFKWPERVPVSVDDADDDTERTASPDCPVHGDRPASTSRCGGLRAGLRPDSQRTDTRRAPGPPDADAPTAAPSSEETEPAPSSGGLVASPHSTPSSRTAPRAATTALDTASEETSPRTDGTSTRHGSSAPRPDMHESSTGSGDSADARDPRSPSDTVGSVLSAARTVSTGLHDAVRIDGSSISAGSASGERRSVPSVRTTASSTDRSSCTCTYHKVIIQESSHFAAFPSEIPRRCILAGSRPGDTVLDPFLGSGTTAMVADRLGRDAIGIELNPKYVEIAKRRIESDERLFSEPVQVEPARQSTLFEGMGA